MLKTNVGGKETFTNWHVHCLDYLNYILIIIDY